MADRKEAADRLAKALESQGIQNVGVDGEVVVKSSDQVRLAIALEQAGFGMVLASVKSEAGDDDPKLFKIITAPRSIKDIIGKVVPDSSDKIAQKIKVDPVLRAVQMNMIAFD